MESTQHKIYEIEEFDPTKGQPAGATAADQWDKQGAEIDYGDEDKKIPSTTQQQT
jgi:hypothetical protein